MPVYTPKTKELNLNTNDKTTSRHVQLREAQLEEAYKAHALEWAKDPEAEFWDTAAVDDGLDEL